MTEVSGGPGQFARSLLNLRFGRPNLFIDYSPAVSNSRDIRAHGCSRPLTTFRKIRNTLSKSVFEALQYLFSNARDHKESDTISLLKSPAILTQ